MKSITLSIILVVLLGSCQSEKEKLINAEFGMIQAHWVINSFSFSPNTPETMKDVLKTGEIQLRSCKYDDKRFNTDAVVCGGDAVINDLFWGVSYRYLYDKRLFVFQLAVDNRDGSYREGGPHSKITKLINGEWNFAVSGNTLTATQTTSYGTPQQYLVSFTATRK